MAELNKSASDTFTASDCDSIDQQMVVQTTSDRTGVEGRMQARTDLDQIQVYTGSAWRVLCDYGTPSTYTPSVTQSGAVTVTVNGASYEEAGSFVHVWLDLAVTGSGTTNNNVTVSLPITMSPSFGGCYGTGVIYDASAGNRYLCGIERVSSTTIGFAVHITDGSAASGLWGKAPNLALASGDVIRAEIRYWR